MPNGFAEYKSVKDAPSVFLRERVALIFNGFPCVSEGKVFVEAKLTWVRRPANFAAHAGNQREKGEASSEGSRHRRHRSAEPRLPRLNSEVFPQTPVCLLQVSRSLQSRVKNPIRIKANKSSKAVGEGGIDTTRTENKRLFCDC